MVNNKALTITIDHEVYYWVIQEAKKQNRNVSNMIETIIRIHSEATQDIQQQQHQEGKGK